MRVRVKCFGLAAVAFAATLILTGCSGNPTPRSPDSASSSSASPPTGASPGASASTAQQSRLITVNQTIRDDEMGDTIKVQGLVRNFPIPDSLPNIKGVRELVLLKFTLNAGSKYYRSLSGSDFTVVGDDGSPNSATSSLDAEITAAGYTPLKEVEGGDTGTGWVAFMVSPVNSKALTLRYKRLAAKVIGSSKPIPEKIFEVPLVK